MTWIPIEQQLPDDDIEVLVFGPDLEDHCWIGYMDGDVWRADNGSRIEVTHWMHLPSSPGKNDSSKDVDSQDETREFPEKLDDLKASFSS